MFRKIPSSSPGPRWEALQEPEPSSDDELDTEDGEVDILLEQPPGRTRSNIRRVTDSNAEATRHPTQPAPPTSVTNAVISDNSRSQMKRKDSEFLFTSKKRVRHVQAAGDDVMEWDMDEHMKDERNINSKTEAVQRTANGLGGRQSQLSDNILASPSTSTNAKPDLPRNKASLKPPSFPLSDSALIESKRPATWDLPSQLLSDAYKRVESKILPSASDRSVAPIFVDKSADKDKALKRQVLPASQTTRHPSTPKAKLIPPDTEIIEISDDDDDLLPPSISRAKSKSNSIKPSSVKAFRTSAQAKASGSAPSSATKELLPKAPIEVIEIFDSDEEQSSAEAQLQQKNVVPSPDSPLSRLVQECATGSHIRRGRPRSMSSSGRDGFENSDGDGINVDEARNLLQPAPAVPNVTSAHSIESDSDDPFRIPSSPRALSPTNESQATRGLLPLPSSSPSSVGLSPKGYHLSLPPALTTPVALLTRPSLSQQPSIPTMGSIFVRKPVASAAAGGQGFSSAVASSSSQVPPSITFSRQFARKVASFQPTSDQDEDSDDSGSEHSEEEGAVGTKANKGKEKEIRQSSSSSSGDEYTSMRPMWTASAMDSDTRVKQLISATQPKKVGQTLAEAITWAGQLNRMKKGLGRWSQGNTQDVPTDLTSGVEARGKDVPTVDENEKALKAAIGSSRLLVSLLPALRGKSSAGVAAAFQVTEPMASSSHEKKPLFSPPRTQDSHSTAELAKSTTKIERSYPFSTVSPEPSQATPKTQIEQSTTFGFRSGTAVIGPPKKIPLPKRPSAARIGMILAANSDGDSASQQTSPTGSHELPEKAGGGDDDLPMIEPVPSPTAAVMTPSSVSVPLPSSLSQPVLMNGSSFMPDKPFERPTPPKTSPLEMTETSFVASVTPGDRDGGTPLQPSTIDHLSEGSCDDDVMMTAISSHKPHSPKVEDVQQDDIIPSRTIIASKSPPPKSPESPIPSIPAQTGSPCPQPTAVTDTMARNTTLETILPSETPLSVHPPASTMATSSGGTAAQDGTFDALSLPSDSPEDEAEDCRALSQSSSDDMDVVPHEVQFSSQDNIMVRHFTQINHHMPIASSSALTSISTATVFNEEINVPLPKVPLRRSSRSSSRSSAEGLGTFIYDDFELLDSVPATRTPTPENQEPSASSSPGSPKTYGGFQALTWKNFRKDLNNFTPKCYYAKDLPHALQDHINSMSEYTQMLGGMRDLFEATILENTVEDEPDAPPIEIFNHVDTQATPPWEFYYTNCMWLGEGVPPPDIKNLVSCTCKGGCNPKSKTCACLMRQRAVTGDPSLEFAYDKNGKLKTPGYPIFECNDLCGCGDECRNRVVQHGRKVSVNIAKTENKGWGVFAGPKKIPVGTFIGIYAGELLTDEVAHERGVKYNKFGRTYLFDIDFHHLKDCKDWVNMYTVDAYHAGNFTRFLNHSCDPNCRLYACYINEGDVQKPLLAIFSRRDIDPYEEICFNYQGIYPNDDDDEDSDNDDDKALDPDHGKESVYAPCGCGAKNCTGTMFK